MGEEKGEGGGVGVEGEEREKRGGFGGVEREIGRVVRKWGGKGGERNGKGDTVFFNISSLSPLPYRLNSPISPQLVQCIPSSHALAFFPPVQDLSHLEAFQVHGGSRNVLFHELLS